MLVVHSPVSLNVTQSGASTRWAALRLVSGSCSRNPAALKGYHSAWLAPDPDLAEIEADRLVYEAGLGATVEEIEKPVLVRSIADIRERMATWGVDLPPFSHPKMGTF